MQYRKKPVVIDAIELKFSTESQDEIIQWSNNTIQKGLDGGLRIPTLEGIMVANTGDYIIRGIKGEYYPCKPDIFEMTYELASTLPQQEISDNTPKEENKTSFGKISDESWEGCDGCTEQDEIMYKNGYVKGYNAAMAELPKEISDEEIEKGVNNPDNDAYSFREGAKWYREQLKQRQ